MISVQKTKVVKEFGDFQTPKELTFEICQLLSRLNVEPQTVIEPNCGLGNFLQAARKVFFSAQIFGFDVSPEYVEQAQDKFRGEERISIKIANFFEENWKEFFQKFPSPILVLGNPPWVTNSQLSVLASGNVPKKENFQSFSGLEAITGKSNFDISEWMLIRLFEALDKQNAHLAMLCKTSVARKILKYAWKNKAYLESAAIYKIETEKHFNASVDSCLLFCKFSKTEQSSLCKIFENLNADVHSREIGFRDGELIASINLYEKWKHLNGGSNIKWRSGIKHDCSKVMELTREGDKFKNGLGEIFELENDFVYPMLKSSDVANGNLEPKRWMLVPQKDVQDDTSKIGKIAPKTWDYLNSHAPLLDKRGSSIYRKRSRFAVFGIGDYSFSPWKVAISGLYKKIDFRVVGGYESKPIVLDDTCYFISCKSEIEANRICSLLNSEISKQFFKSYIFWDAKRPITVDVLQKLDILKLANKLGVSELESLISKQPDSLKQPNLFQTETLEI